MLEFEKACANSSEAISKLKAEVKFIDDHWEKLAFEIKGNILAQCRVICSEADFSEVRLDKHVVSGCIEVAPDDDEEGDLESPESERTNLAANLLSYFLYLFFFVFFVFCAFSWALCI